MLEKVKSRFLDRKFIEHIEVIPDTYLRSSNGIEGMQQVARLYGVDVMALASYDQVSMIEDNKASMLYWTMACGPKGLLVGTAFAVLRAA